MIDMYLLLWSFYLCCLSLFGFFTVIDCNLFQLKSLHRMLFSVSLDNRNFFREFSIHFSTFCSWFMKKSWMVKFTFKFSFKCIFNWKIRKSFQSEMHRKTGNLLMTNWTKLVHEKLQFLFCGLFWNCFNFKNYPKRISLAISMQAHV